MTATMVEPTGFVDAEQSSQAATLRAARAALAVGASLLAGAGFAAVVRIALPRVLGPAAYGHYRLAESAAELVLILLTLGLDTTLRRDVAQRPSEAGEQCRIRRVPLLGEGVQVSHRRCKVSRASISLEPIRERGERSGAEEQRGPAHAVRLAGQRGGIVRIHESTQALELRGERPGESAHEF